MNSETEKESSLNNKKKNKDNKPVSTIKKIKKS